jgi:hypothetical protein
MKFKELFEGVLEESGQKPGETQEQYYERLRKRQKALRDRKKEMNKDPQLEQKLKDLKDAYNDNWKVAERFPGGSDEAKANARKEMARIRGEIQKIHNEFKKKQG